MHANYSQTVIMLAKKVLHRNLATRQPAVPVASRRLTYGSLRCILDVLCYLVNVCALGARLAVVMSSTPFLYA